LDIGLISELLSDLESRNNSENSALLATEDAHENIYSPEEVRDGRRRRGVGGGEEGEERSRRRRRGGGGGRG
jgi:hypothetical protein